jgi:hypothetical protein
LAAWPAEVPEKASAPINGWLPRKIVASSQAGDQEKSEAWSRSGRRKADGPAQKGAASNVAITMDATTPTISGRAALRPYLGARFWAILAAKYFWEIAVNGHNDMVMTAFALFALERADRRHWSVALPLLTVSVMAKYVSLILVPLLVLAAFVAEGRCPSETESRSPERRSCCSRNHRPRASSEELAAIARLVRRAKCTARIVYRHHARHSDRIQPVQPRHAAIDHVFENVRR